MGIGSQTPSSPFLPLLALYLAAMLALAWRARRRSATPDGFFVASRALGPFLATCALSGTVVSGSATLVAADVIHERGLPGAWLDLAGAVALVALGLLLAGRVRRTRLTTLPEIAGAAFGPAVRRIAAAVSVIAQVAFVALLARGVATVAAPLAGVDPALACVLATAVTAAATLVGGQVAVAITDVAQLALMSVAVFAILLPFSLASARDGSALPLPDGFVEFPLNARFGALDLLGFALLYGLPHVVGSDVYSKLLSARDAAAARTAAIASGVVKAAFGAAVAAVALAARTRAEVKGDASVLPAMLVLAVPEPWRAIGAIGLVAVLMSTANTVLLTASTVVARDLLPARFATLPAARIATGLIGALGLALALAEGETLLAPFRLGYTVYAAGLSLPVLAAFLPEPWRPRGRFVIAAMALGGGAALSLHAARLDASGSLPTFAGLALSLAALLAGIAARRRRTGR